MEGAEENREKFDLLRKFMEKQNDCPNKNKQQQGEDDEIELSLGLSMNGRFGVDPTRNKKLKRSSSIANLVFAVGGGLEIGAAPHARGPEFESHAPPLARTQSLPVETEEECRRRKELQSTRRMEARKKRMEKLKNLRVLKDKENLFKDVGNGKNVSHEVLNGNFNGQRLGNGNLRRFENGDVIESSQGSIRPPRSGSSASSDLIEGPKPKQNAEVSPSSHHEEGGQEPARQAADKDAKGQGKLLKNAMFDMPYVTTKETGPNGRKVEGFLYRYKRGEEVRIVCVCHGTFLTPKEFIEHGGGGGDVEHPLKHIVVNPFPLL